LIARAMAQAIVARTRSLAATSSTPREDTSEIRSQKARNKLLLASGLLTSVL
jgi:hypothetical protein